MSNTIKVKVKDLSLANDKWLYVGQLLDVVDFDVDGLYYRVISPIDCTILKADCTIVEPKPKSLLWSDIKGKAFIIECSTPDEELAVKGICSITANSEGSYISAYGFTISNKSTIPDGFYFIPAQDFIKANMLPQKQSYKWLDLRGTKTGILCDTEEEVKQVSLITGIQTPKGRMAIPCDCTMCMSVPYATELGYTLIPAKDFIAANTQAEVSKFDMRSPYDLLDPKEESISDIYNEFIAKLENPAYDDIPDNIRQILLKDFYESAKNIELTIESYNPEDKTIGSAINLKQLEDNLDNALDKETPESLTAFLEQHRRPAHVSESIDANKIANKYFPESEIPIQDAVNATSRAWLTSDIQSLIDSSIIHEQEMSEKDKCDFAEWLVKEKISFSTQDNKWRIKALDDGYTTLQLISTYNQNKTEKLIS